MSEKAETVAEQEAAAEKAAAAARRVLKENEWACVDSKCLHVNLNYKNTCEKCGKPKPRSKNKVGHEIGKDAAEKSKGLFAAEDWACSKCGNINWARRTTCNICNAPKFGELEARTGYGGGYMDRQEIEYIERQDSDDEFDEFGRKKKKKGKGEDGEPLEDFEGSSSSDDEDEMEDVRKEEVVEKVEMLDQVHPTIEKQNLQDLDSQKQELEEEESGSSANEEDLAKYDLTFDESPETLREKIMKNRTIGGKGEGGSDGESSPKSDPHRVKQRSDRSPSSGSSCCSLCSITNSPVRGKGDVAKDDRRPNTHKRERRPVPRSRSPKRKRRYID